MVQQKPFSRYQRKCYGHDVNGCSATASNTGGLTINDRPSVQILVNSTRDNDKNNYTDEASLAVCEGTILDLAFGL